MDKKVFHNLYTLLKTAEFNPAVGIRIAPLSGNEYFSFYGAELAPQAKITAHYHKSGFELYFLVKGNGIMYTGKPEPTGAVSWNPALILEEGDCFTINEGEVHQLYNPSDNPVVLVFACPQSHLSTDRIVVGGFNS